MIKTLVLKLIKEGFKKVIRLYQLTFALIIGSSCRFYPSCSRYATASLDKYPLHKALKKITVRLFKCHPFHPGGEDLP